jgi:hypothetical protein
LPTKAAVIVRDDSPSGSDANREAVRAVPTDDLDLVGIGVRAAHKDADAILRGLRRHA